MPSTQTPENFDFTEQEIIDACNRVNFNGFTAVTCGKCKKKANVLVGGQGWICTCEHYNVQVIHGANIPHENPDLGPTRAFLQAAYAKAEEKKKQAT